MIDSITDGAAFSWIVGALIGAVVVILIVGVIRKYDIVIGKVRPQILVVLIALSLIALGSLILNQAQVTAGAVTGMVALATRIIEKDISPNNE